MSALPFAPLPPANVRLDLGPEEWEACLDAWLTLSELVLRQLANDFSKNTTEAGTLPGFLSSFYHELRILDSNDGTLGIPKAISLRKACFKVVARLFTGDNVLPDVLLSWKFFSSFCHAHLRTAALLPLMSQMWRQKSSVIQPKLQKQKDTITTALDSKSIEPGVQLLPDLAAVLHASPDIAAFFMTGSDFLDTLVAAYKRTTTDDQRKGISSIVYLGLSSLVRTEVPQSSLLSDHLYTLKSHGDKTPPNQSVLADIVTNTPLLAKIRSSAGPKSPERLIKLLDTLEMYRVPSIARPRRKVHKPGKKSAGKMAQVSELNIHSMSLVTQIQDLFPDLGSGFILKLLDQYDDDAEQVTAHLLDDSLPPHLAALDRSEQAPIYDTTQQAEIDKLIPRSTPPLAAQSYVPERRNVFDDDELDRLDFDTSRLHIGKRNKRISASDDNEPHKAAILAALAAFDSDDDERDDTYDAEDVGGTIDNTAPDGEPTRVTQEEIDTALFSAYKSAPELFGRTFDVRRSQARQNLKAETRLSDEQIEGWAVILQRDPKRLAKLEARAGDKLHGAQQPELARTSYRDSAGNTETEDSDAGPSAARGSQDRSRGRGRGRGRGGRGGNVAGPAGEASTAQAQKKKEANKSSRANHNRRDGRARKMARGGFPPAG